jgi:hypothetical protein
MAFTKGHPVVIFITPLMDFTTGHILLHFRAVNHTPFFSKFKHVNVSDRGKGSL